MKEIIKIVQVKLNEAGLDAGSVDGIAGKKTFHAIGQLIAQRMPRAISWDAQRQIIAALQIFINADMQEKLVVDGYMGPSTIHGLEQWMHFLKTGKEPRAWRKEKDEILFKDTKNPHNFPKGDHESMCEFYGEPGDTSEHVLIDVPYPLRIAWNPKQVTQKMTVNKKLGAVIYKVLDQVLSDYGRESISDFGLDLFGGCFNYRKKRGGSTLSTHAWAAALDFDPKNNALKMGKDQARFAKPVYEKWWKAWEDEGFVSLGREKNYDFMHIQATA